MSMTRARMEELAMNGFYWYVQNLSLGELHDMLAGNAGTYTGMPQLANWFEPHILDEILTNGRGTD